MEKHDKESREALNDLVKKR